jgi:hypothetical protein
MILKGSDLKKSWDKDVQIKSWSPDKNPQI